MGGKSAKAAPPTLDAAGQAYYDRYPGVAETGVDPRWHYETYGRNEGRTWGVPQPSMPAFHMPSMRMPDMPSGPSGPSYEEQLAEQRRQQGVSERNKLYSEYINAVDVATDYVTSEIEKERANAELLGIEFTMTDELKQNRISNYFATIWGAGDQSRLEGLIDEWGAPAGFDGWILQRGEGGGYAAQPEEPDGTPSSGQTRTLIETEDEDEEEGILGASLVGGM